jgi:hypothetical protein
MQVKYYKLKSKSYDEVYAILDRHIPIVLGTLYNDDNKPYEDDGAVPLCGYNKVIAVYDWVGGPQRFYLIESFDGQKVIIEGYENILSIYHKKEDFLYGDIVNVEIHNDKTGNDKVKILDHHCIPLKNYCPTLEGIKEHIESVGNIYSNPILGLIYNHSERFYSNFNKVKCGLSLDNIKNIKAKMSMIGCYWLDVDINTIAVFNSKTGQINIYSAQQKIIFSYNCDSDYTTPLAYVDESMNYTGLFNVAFRINVPCASVFRNYFLTDIPKSQYDKYRYRYNNEAGL